MIPFRTSTTNSYQELDPSTHTDTRDNGGLVCSSALGSYASGASLPLYQLTVEVASVLEAHMSLKTLWNLFATPNTALELTTSNEPSCSASGHNPTMHFQAYNSFFSSLPMKVYW